MSSEATNYSETNVQVLGFRSSRWWGLCCLL